MFSKSSLIHVLPWMWFVIPLLCLHPLSADAYIGGSWESEAMVLSQSNDSQLYFNSELVLRGSIWTGDSKIVAELSTQTDRSSDGEWNTTADIERLYLTTYFPAWDLIVGKQQISWGTGRAWSPSDIFNPPDPLDPDERRKGVPAFQARIPHGPLSFSSFVIADDADSDKLSWGARYHGYIDGTDWSVFYARKNEESIVGGDIATDWIGLGIHSEIAWEPDHEADHGRILWLAGADYSWLDGKLIWLGEYLFNSADDARHSLFNQLSYSYNEFNSVSVNLLSNLVDGSQAATLYHSAMLNSQWEWTVGGSYFFGDKDTQYGMSLVDYLVQTGLKYSF